MSKKNNEVKAQEVSTTVDMDATQVVDAIQTKLNSPYGGKLSTETLRQIAVEVGFIKPSGRAGTLPTPSGLTFAGVSPEDYARAQAEKTAAEFKTREMAKMEKKLAELRAGTAPITQPTPVNPSA